ncbi:sodium:calcium antiporter [Candidatus Pacearchaeota archaeon]|jgi:cation:H+ antiporter|nr:sodium:calcium antiporter [Candidatus Pacearchaeota archaeon]
MIIDLILCLVFLFVLIKSSNYAIKYSSQLAKKLHLSQFVVSFFIIAIISALPESTIAIISAINGEPSLGVGTLLGGNITDLTLVFGLVALISSSGIKVESKILRNNLLYLIMLFVPIVLGIDGKFSRIDGAILIALGIIFFIRIYKNSTKFRKKFRHPNNVHFAKSLFFLLISLSLILVSAYFTVEFATNFAKEIGVPLVIIGITIIAFGTCLPELIISIKSIKANTDEIALGDLLGTVMTDATIVMGIVALISPFNYDFSGFFMTGVTRFIAGIFVIVFMKTGKSINKIEGIFLILFYILFIFIEIMLSYI